MQKKTREKKVQEKPRTPSELPSFDRKSEPKEKVEKIFFTFSSLNVHVYSLVHLFSLPQQVD